MIIGERLNWRWVSGNLGFLAELGFTLEFCDCWKKSHGEDCSIRGEEEGGWGFQVEDRLGVVQVAMHSVAGADSTSIRRVVIIIIIIIIVTPSIPTLTMTPFITTISSGHTGRRHRAAGAVLRVVESPAPSSPPSSHSLDHYG